MSFTLFLQRNCLYYALTAKPCVRYMPKYKIQEKLLEFVSHPFFKVAIIVALLLNCIALALQVLELIPRTGFWYSIHSIDLFYLSPLSLCICAKKVVFFVIIVCCSLYIFLLDLWFWRNEQSYLLDQLCIHNILCIRSHSEDHCLHSISKPIVLNGVSLMNAVLSSMTCKLQLLIRLAYSSSCLIILVTLISRITSEKSGMALNFW